VELIGYTAIIKMIHDAKVFVPLLILNLTLSSEYIFIICNL